MILTKRAALNGVQLDQLHESIVIRSCDPGVTRESIQAVNLMGGSGQRVTGSHWETIEASVTFAIDISKRDMETRKQIFDKALAWAVGKGWLTVGWMPGKRLWVDKVILPGGGDMFAWTDEYTIVFRAYAVPFWVDVNPEKVNSASAASGTVTISNRGNARSVLDITFANRSGSTITSFTVACGGRSIALSGLSLANNASLMIAHGTDGLMTITAGGTSVYDKRTGADELYIEPGAAQVSFSASGTGVMTAQCYGRWIA